MTFGRAAVAIALGCWAFTWGYPALAQPSSGHLIGGTAALVGGDQIDQLASHPVTSAEVALVAALLSASHPSGEKGATGQALSVAARRAAVLLRLLAYKARLMGEQARAEDVQTAKRAVSRALNGDDQVKGLLARLGIRPQEHQLWLEDLTLAKAQLGYAIEAAVATLPTAAVSEPSANRLDPASLEALRQLVESALDEGVLRVLP
jgi:hypothetical protein